MFLHPVNSNARLYSHMCVCVQVLGNVKGVVAVVLSVLWFKNPISFIGMLGYSITVGGVVAYSQARSLLMDLKP